MSGPRDGEQPPAAGRPPVEDSGGTARRVDVLRARLSKLRLPLVFFFAINLVLLAGYLWSRGGETTHVRVIARGNVFEAFVDGRPMSKERVDAAPAAGGIALAIENTHEIPSLPKPRGIDRIRVTDSRSGAVLFQDDFSHGLDPAWTLAATSAVNDHGVLDVKEGAILLANRSWSDVIVDVDFKNVVGATVLLRAQDASTGVLFGLRPFRHYDSNLTVIDHGQVVTSYVAGTLAPPRRELLKALVAMTLRPYPLAVVLFALGLLLVIPLQFVKVPRMRLKLPQVSPRLLWFGGAGALAAGAFGVAAFLMHAYGDSMPHDNDAVAYMFQAKIFASGSIAAPPPPVAQVFDYSLPSFFPVSHGKWASVYPFGQSLALAVGQKLGAMWVVPPLLGAASVLLTFEVGRRLYNARLGLLAALLLASSPFFFMQSSNFLSHNTAVFYLLVSLLFLVIEGKRPWLYGAVAGLFFGLFFNTQSLAAVALMPALSCLFLARLAPSGQRRHGVLRAIGFAAGALAMLGAYYLYNYGARGDLSTSGFAVAGFKNAIGFGGQHSVIAGMENEQAQMAFLLLVLNGWPQSIGLIFVLAMIMLATRNLWDWFLLACAVSMIGAYTLFAGNGITIGPRYWYPAAPFLMLLTARGADRSADLLAAAAAWVRQRTTGVAQQPRWVARLAVYAVVAALIGSAISGWLLSRDIAWHADFVPERSVNLQSYYGADDRLVRVIEDAKLKNALILIEPCGGWQCYGTVFWLNSPKLDGAYVIAKDLPARLPELFLAYPNRAVYVASYPTPALAPYGFKAESAIGVPLSQFPPAPLAKDLRLRAPTPTATPASGGGDSIVRDERRRTDLASIAAALQQYRERHGSYPKAEGVQSLCRYPADSGCSLVAVLDPLPRDPVRGSTYYYQSDTLTFLLFAIMENRTDASACPAPLAPELSRVPNLYCVAGGR